MNSIFSPEGAAQPQSSLFSTQSLWGMLAAAGSGAVMTFSMPPWGFWPLAFISLVALDLLLDGCIPKQRAARGVCFGLGWLLPSFIWMWDFSPIGYASAVVAYSVFYGAGILFCPKDSRFRWWVLPAVLTLVGYLRWRWPFGGVPLSTIAMSQVDSPLAGAAPVFGSLLMVWLTAVVSVSFAALWRREWRHAVAGPVLLVLALSLAPLAPRAEAVGTLDVALVQGGGPQRTRAASTDFTTIFSNHQEASLLLLDDDSDQVTDLRDEADRSRPVDLVLWPENVVDVDGSFADSDISFQLFELAQQLGAPLVVGVIEDGEPGRFNNFSVVIPHRTDDLAAPTEPLELGDRYDKVRRVPFGEYVPMRWLVEPFAPNFLPSREATEGTEPPLLEVELVSGVKRIEETDETDETDGDTDEDLSSVKLGTLISWEVFFEDRLRHAISQDAQLIVNPTNGSSYWLTIVQSQQVASSRLRALESDRQVVQIAPTGFSAVISPDGEVLARTGTVERRVLVATVELREGRTLAVTYGVWPVLGLALTGALCGFVLWRRRDREYSDRPRKFSPRWFAAKLRARRVKSASKPVRQRLTGNQRRKLFNQPRRSRLPRRKRKSGLR